MACTHAATCPLFPLLNASLDGWRRCYCDSADGWRDCARYQLSVRGQYVPLSLLPNGRDARHLQGAGRGADGSVGAGLAGLLFEQAPAPPPPLVGLPEPRRPEPGPRVPARAVSPRRRWWTRLMEWMRSPA